MSEVHEVILECDREGAKSLLANGLGLAGLHLDHCIYAV